jgi:hypothetical protein
MSNTPAEPRAYRPTYPWWVVLCLVGLDYFSSLAYLPSIAMRYAEALAPLTGVAVVAVTLLAALPVYWYVVGRSPHGKGGVGLLEERFHGWGGKLTVLAMLGFVATDFVLTRTLSVSDAATHILANPLYQENAPRREAIDSLFPGPFGQALVGFWSEQLVLTVLLSVLAFALYHWMVRRLSQGFVGVAVGVVALYLLVNGIVIGSGLLYIKEHPAVVEAWRAELARDVGMGRLEAGNAFWLLLLLAFQWFPPMAIGLSGFELTTASAPDVRGGPHDTPRHPTGRIWRTRLMMLVAALVMGVLVLGANFVVPLLVPTEGLKFGTDVQHRALAYLAHGQTLRDGSFGDALNPIFGVQFGTVYDISTVLILCLAGATATITLRELVPDFLSRFGMQLSWAHRVGVITHLFNGVILVVAVAFRASVTAQLWAYAAAVLALLFGASLAATLDVRTRWLGNPLRIVLQLPFLLITLLFALMGVLIVVRHPSGIGIALLFVLVVMGTGIASRWIRSSEMRFEGFAFEDDESKKRWEEICKLEFQVLVPHDPKHTTLKFKEHEVRERHRIPPDVPIIFIEVQVGDPSDFFQRPVMDIDRDDDGREVIRISRATSVAHVLAAIGLAFREVGHPPEFFFKWSNLSPMEATANFLLLGQGNIPFLVRSLVHRAEPDETRRPKVVVADG